MVDQSTSNTGIPHPSSGQTWYQSFTAEHSSKLQKFAFVTNGAFTASATVKIREGEGVTGTVLHTGTWTGIGSNTNNYNESSIGNDAVLTQDKNTPYNWKIRPQVASSDRTPTNTPAANSIIPVMEEYGDLKMKIWVLRQTQGSGYQSPGGGYQTSGSGYQSGGTNLRDKATNLGGYQSPGHGYQSPTRLSNAATRGMDTNLRGMAIRGHGYQSPGHGYQTPGHGYQSPGHGYQSPDTATNRRSMAINLQDTVIKRRDTAINRQPMGTTYWILPTKSLKFGRWGIKSFLTIFF